MGVSHSIYLSWGGCLHAASCNMPRRLAYIDPRVVESYLGGRTLEHFRQLVENKLEN
ncbi:hypothetical protein CZ787_18930 [Halomonas citrativorans]|uniref:Uncharacterized protein n=1 Tax=Halomonas citrativorans TaxID=2742612 RepID=A0A1R4I7B7_9GAMM|nr:hypothetical protein CZ787_18930 [Halomonas citrativorans]